MHAARVLIAALLFLAFTLGMPMHAATAHVSQSTSNALPAYTIADHGKGHCCPDHDRKGKTSAVCQMACSAGLAIQEWPAMLGTHSAYAVQFNPELLAAKSGVTLPLDPFPPRPSRIA